MRARRKLQPDPRAVTLLEHEVLRYTELVGHATAEFGTATNMAVE